MFYFLNYYHQVVGYEYEAKDTPLLVNIKVMKMKLQSSINNDIIQKQGRTSPVPSILSLSAVE